MLKQTIVDFLNQMNEFHATPVLTMASVVLTTTEENDIAQFFSKNILSKEDIIKQHDIQILKDILNKKELSFQDQIDQIWDIVDSMDEDDREVVWEWVDTILEVAKRS